MMVSDCVCDGALEDALPWPPALGKHGRVRADSSRGFKLPSHNCCKIAVDGALDKVVQLA